MSFSNIFDTLMFAILIIGGINWGLVGLFNLDLVAFLFATSIVASKIIYCAVGFSAFYVLFRQLSKRNT